MRPTLLAALCAILCAGPTVALAQDEDDWEFQHEASLNQMVAAVRYDAGVAIVVQCRDNALSAALIGMPAGVGGLEVQARRADGRTDVQTWAPGPAPGILLSTVPARDIRFMRGGGLYSVRTVEGAPRALRTNFDLPTQSANLDRVLAACGWGLTDDRDQLIRAGSEVSFRDPDAPPVRLPQPRRGRGARPGMPDAPEAPAPSVPVLEPAESQISCVLRAMRLTVCRLDHPPTAAGNEAARSLRRLEGVQMYAADAAAAEGKVVYTAGPRTVTVIDYIAIGR
ncbi:hypothetical protein [Brevundimonas sp.]|uniref:hypothetical protein n=1 Tax=Brevundimonas sp. TaxID=1871086 RepID=UPI003F72F60B